jgi:hypothetical protein
LESTGSSSAEDISRTSRIGNLGFLMVLFLHLDEPISLGRAFSPSEESAMTSGTFDFGVGRPGRFRVGDIYLSAS